MVSRGRRRTAEATRAALAVLAALTLGPACVKSKVAEEPVGVTGNQPPVLAKEVTFAFDSIDERPVSSDAARGRICVLALVTTWDLTSQAQVNYLNAMAKHDGDRVFYAMVAVQERGTRELVEAYKQSLKIPYPIAMVEPAVLAERGIFGDVRQVPTMVVLDRAGRIVWMKTGLAKPEELRGEMNKL